MGALEKCLSKRKLRDSQVQGVVSHPFHGLQMQFGIICLIIENSPAIQKQDGLFLLPDGFYHVCAPGQTAQFVATSGGARINVPHYKTGVKDCDAPVALGISGNREQDAQQEKNSNGRINRFIEPPVIF
ncbi:MAG: hypothetical protein NTW71_13610 [Deltaproteobacteria bacterium]|nr:hypothetical protein [Deltaproteobacteria bacterium]